MKSVGLPLVCLAMFVIAGGHWAVFQSVAWGRMLWTYSQEEGSVVSGARKTFSGEAPCPMCKKIAEAKKQEEKAPATLKIAKKAEADLVAFGGTAPLPVAQDFVFPARPDAFWTRSEAPPIPVPIVQVWFPLHPFVAGDPCFPGAKAPAVLP